MRRFSTTVEIQASAGRVFSVLLDIEHWPEWTATMTSVQRLENGPIRVGHRARVRQPKLPPAIWQVTELDERSFTWVSRSPGVQVAGRHYIGDKGTGSRVTLILEYSGLLSRLAAYFYRNLSERYLAIEAKGLKDRSENRVLDPGSSQPSMAP
jgi:uncharacterized membrane protein